MTTQEKIESLRELIAESKDYLVDMRKLGMHIQVAETEEMVKEAKRQLQILQG